MTVVDGRTALEVLSPRQCHELLAAASVGRVAVIVDGHPEIFPVNFAIDDGDVVFRTAPGTKLAGATQWPSVAFEIDGTDADGCTGWSVLVVGRAEEVHVTAELRRLERLALVPWAAGAKLHWVRLRPSHLSGRRILSSASPGGAAP